MKTTTRAILSLFLFFAIGLHGQNPLSISVKAGLNLSDYYGDIEDNDIKAGYNAGISVDYRLNKNFYILSGVEVTSKGTRVKYNKLNDTPEQASTLVRTKWNPLYLQVPLHAGYTVRAAEDMLILFHIGPYVSYGIGGKVTTKEKGNEQQSKTEYDAFGSDGLLKRWDVGLGIGAGFEFKGIGVNLGYDLGFLKQSRDKEYKLRNNVAHITFAYRIF